MDSIDPDIRQRFADALASGDMFALFEQTREAIGKYPDDPQVRYLQALAMARLGDPDEIDRDLDVRVRLLRDPGIGYETGDHEHDQDCDDRARPVVDRIQRADHEAAPPKVSAARAASGTGATRSPAAT